ncbi:MAG TPA: cytochrome c oxidase assembly protein, partial [Steroidobacteraceae bacterium]|nr:cytochrome c oxidase assembly protein [Steroidobacteraceae bacterium]
ICHVGLSNERRTRIQAAAGWLVAAVAFISPLCALSVSLFSARIGQHMMLLLIAAPLIALALPASHLQRGTRGLWATASAFFVALWVWHMPTPYDATFTSTALYGLMHLTLFGCGILLWRELLQHRPAHTIEVLVVGVLTSMQMTLLGAVLTLAGHPLFSRHLLTAAAWGLSPMQDQQLGGILMWIPGTLLFLWAAVRSLRRLWSALESPKVA